jgi:hypothetical protein
VRAVILPSDLKRVFLFKIMNRLAGSNHKH